MTKKVVIFKEKIVDHNDRAIVKLPRGGYIVSAIGTARLLLQLREFHLLIKIMHSLRKILFEARYSATGKRLKINTKI